MTLYAWLMLGSLAGPLLLSFDKKVAYYKQWIPLFAGILINGIFFVLWDSYFTEQGIWSFNSAYVANYRLLGLPLEEWSFFIVIPYCSIFIYACVKAYMKLDFLVSWSKIINVFFMLILLAIIILYPDRRYTFYNSVFAFVLLFFHTFYFKKSYLPYFWVAYFIHLIPFLIINGVLTSKPVVIYNNLEIIGPRIYTIPVEDSIYALTCLLLPITVMEWLLNRRATSQAQL